MKKLEGEDMGAKNGKGITLIALVITIILLLILAGKNGKDTLVSQKGATVWVDISQESAKSTAKTMYTDNSHVKSALISGI